MLKEFTIYIKQKQKKKMSTQQNPTLIPGFEDIMRHIRQQEDQIKKLENTVKNCGENYTKLYQDHVDLQEENKKQKEDHCSNKKIFFEVYEEFKKLREVESLLQPFENTETFRMKVEEMKKENQELQEKITCLESDSHNEVSQAEYDELEAEKKYLENEVTRYSVALEEEYVLKSEYDEVKERKDKAMKLLEESDKENTELKEEITRIGEEKDAHWNDWLNEEFGDDLYPLNPPEPDDFVEKIKKLKEENKRLKDKTIIYHILDESYKGMSKNQKAWIDSNWKSIIIGFAETLESMVPENN